jgi:hypothetical protein
MVACEINTLIIVLLVSSLLRLEFVQFHVFNSSTSWNHSQSFDTSNTLARKVFYVLANRIVSLNTYILFSGEIAVIIYN